MKKLLFLAVALFFTATLHFAQAQQSDTNINVLPMFGKKPKTDLQQQKDEKFLTSCDKSFNNRREASDFFMERGWEYFNEGQVDTAVYRFNLAWLLNPDNVNTHWAFGMVTAMQGDMQQAISFYEGALKIAPKNSLLLSDVGSSYLNLYRSDKKKKNLKKANTYLEQALAYDATNSFALYNVSLIKFYEKKYADSWSYLHKSRELDLSHIDYSFLDELMAKMPDPKGMFRQGLQEDTAAVDE
jgi:tetratricopeptide (TPR) repeat protein